MPYFDSSQAWLHHSSLLLQAQPTTTRITTKYTLTPPPSTSKPPKRNPSRRHQPQPPPIASADSQPPPPSTTRGTLTLKTYDPTSGVCLKYRTDKAAEVGRLIASLGRLGRYMGALPVRDAGEEKEKEDVVMGDGGAGQLRHENGTGRSTPVVDVGSVPVKEGKGGVGVEKGKAMSGVGGGSGGGMKKKKGKK